MRVVTSFALVLCLCFVWGTFAGVEAETVPIGTPELVASLEVLNNFCNDFSKEKFLCHVVFSEFCTYCRKDSGNKCVTKHQVTEYEKDGYHCEGQPSPSPPSPHPHPPPTPAHGCQSEDTEKSCTEQQHCEWCIPKDALNSFAAGCYTDTAAHLLPKHQWTCTAHPPSPSPSPAPPEPKRTCNSIISENDCEDDRDCEWCSLSNGDRVVYFLGDGRHDPLKTGCYSVKAAKLLPKDKWKCSSESKPLSPPVCKSKGTKNDCTEHSHCHWCTHAEDGIKYFLGDEHRTELNDGCYSNADAKNLPESSWKCEHGASGAEFERELLEYSDLDASDLHTRIAVAEAYLAKLSRPNISCHYPNHFKCSLDATCEWCAVADARGNEHEGACFTRTDAGLLPSAIWKCHPPAPHTFD